MTTPDQVRAALAADLAASIRRARDDVDADRLTTALLDWDERHRFLVGLHDGATKAVYYDRMVSLIHSFPVPEGQLDALDDVTSDTARYREAVPAYVYGCGEDHWDWLHPRYRWVFGEEVDVDAAADE